MNDTNLINNSNSSRYKNLPSDRFLQACPIKYDCRNLYIYLIEMEYCPNTQTIEVLLNYPEQRDKRYFKDDNHLNDFISKIKQFTFPYVKTLYENNNSNKNSLNNTHKASSSLVQFYSFAFTDSERIRQYGFCRSAQSGNHVLCMISYFPWYNVFISILNKISNIINEKETQTLYNFLEALYEYELPEPGNYAQILSHDGLDEIKFQCPDRRVIPSIHENRNLLKFFAFFDLNVLKKLFTSLLLERSILVVSKDLENLTSCGLSLEYLIYPLEWLHTFVPIFPETINLDFLYQPSPSIYGIHTCIYEKLNKSELTNSVILLVDERQILNADKDQLPADINDYLTKKLDYFKNDQVSTITQNSSGGSNSKTYDLLHTGPIKPFLDSVLMIIDDYREYIVYDSVTNEFKLDEIAFFRSKNVNYESTPSRYQSNENEFYHEFRITQAFEEFWRDRADYLKKEKNFSNTAMFNKDFIDSLFDQYIIEKSKLSNKIAKEKSSTIKSNLIKTRNQLIKKSNSSENEFNNSNSINKSIKSSNESSNLKLNINQEQNQQIMNQSDSKIISLKNSLSIDKGYSSIQNEYEAYDKDDEESDIIKSPNLSNSDESASTSTSCRSSLSTNEDQIKNTIKIFAEATGKFENFTDNNITSNRISQSRMTIDLSNDPDIKKYFETNLSINDMNVRNEFDESNLTTILENTNQINQTNQTNQQSGQLIDFFCEENSSQNSNHTQSSTSSLTSSHSNLIVLNPSIVHNNQNSQKSETTNLKSIIDEFDPISDSSLKQTNMINKNFSNINNLDQNKQNFQFQTNFSNLTAKPFQAPNYHVNLPPVNNNMGIKSLNSNSAHQLSYNSNANTNSNFNQIRPNVNPFLPTPFYHSNGYRPVQFNANSFNSRTNNNNNSPNLPITSAQFNINNLFNNLDPFSNLNQQQQNQTKNNK